MRRILIVDPAITHRSHLRSVCAAYGHASVDETESGEEAWMLLARDPGAYALVISEVRLLHLDGINLLRRLRADPRGREVPLVFLTSENDPSFALAAGAGGATDYLLRPHGIDALRERLRELAGKPGHEAA